MPTVIQTPIANEESTYGIPFTFTDDTAAAVVPLTAQWTLLKKVGSNPAVETIIRGPVAITPPSSTYIIVLTADDLALVIGEGHPKTRYVLVEYTYSSSLGVGLPAKDTISFSIANLVGVS